MPPHPEYNRLWYWNKYMADVGWETPADQVFVWIGLAAGIYAGIRGYNRASAVMKAAHMVDSGEQAKLMYMHNLQPIHIKVPEEFAKDFRTKGLFAALGLPLVVMAWRFQLPHEEKTSGRADKN
jgi:hypothetical protein